MLLLFEEEETLTSFGIDILHYANKQVQTSLAQGGQHMDILWFIIWAVSLNNPLRRAKKLLTLACTQWPFSVRQRNWPASLHPSCDRPPWLWWSDHEPPAASGLSPPPKRSQHGETLCWKARESRGGDTQPCSYIKCHNVHTHSYIFLLSITFPLHNKRLNAGCASMSGKVKPVV